MVNPREIAGGEQYARIAARQASSRIRSPRLLSKGLEDRERDRAIYAPVKLILLLLFAVGCGANASPLPKGPPPEYEQEPAPGASDGGAPRVVGADT
jgi:hypothetical protein